MARQRFTIPLGEWKPDQSGGYDSGTLMVVNNIFPIGTPDNPKWGPIPAFEPMGADPLPTVDAPRGLFAARRKNGLVRILAGTNVELFQKDTTTTWDNITGAFTPAVALGLYWQFAQWGKYVYIASYANSLYKFDIEAGFGTNMTAVTAPQGKYIATFGPFMVLGQNLLAAADVEQQTFTNSAIENPDVWTIGTSLCDEQVLPDGGVITGLASAGGQDGYIVQETKIRRAVFQPGSDIAFRFETVEERKGAIRGYTVVAVAGTIFYLSHDGFYSYGPQGLRAIGDGRVNKWFYNEVNRAQLDRTQGFVDVNSTRVGWAFATGITNILDRIIYYDWQLDRWSCSTESGYVFASGRDEVNVSGTMIEWPVLATIDASRELSYQKGRLGVTDGALLRTCKMHLVPGERSFVSSIYPIGDWNDDIPGVSVGRAENPSAVPVPTSVITPSASTGRIPFRAGGRIHKFSVDVSLGVGTNWTSVEGLLVDVHPDGLR